MNTLDDKVSRSLSSFRLYSIPCLLVTVIGVGFGNRESILPYPVLEGCIPPPRSFLYLFAIAAGWIKLGRPLTDRVDESLVRLGAMWSLRGLTCICTAWLLPTRLALGLGLRDTALLLSKAGLPPVLGSRSSIPYFPGCGRTMFNMLPSLSRARFSGYFSCRPQWKVTRYFESLWFSRVEGNMTAYNKIQTDVLIQSKYTSDWIKTGGKPSDQGLQSSRIHIHC